MQCTWSQSSSHANKSKTYLRLSDPSKQKVSKDLIVLGLRSESVYLDCDQKVCSVLLLTID